MDKSFNKDKCLYFESNKFSSASFFASEILGNKKLAVENSAPSKNVAWHEAE